ncbi:sensor histidine kinase [Novosphingopyxis sp.]|uniref:sensor histidine kinase n=1 Tax=Novosphingopyxis sp. TaxID=2709690 RepID=UPI003B5C1ECB
MTAIEQHRGTISLPLAFLSIVGFWLIYAIVNTARAVVMGFPAQDELIWRRVAVTLVGIALTFCFCLLLRLLDRRPLGQRIAAAFIGAAPIAILMSLFNYWLFNVYASERIFSGSGDGAMAQPLSMEQTLAELALNRYFFLAAWGMLFLALSYAREVRAAERHAARLSIAAHEAEMRSLRYQVNPHFLFNTLNSLSALVMRGDNDRAEAMIMNLATFYRTSLASDPLADVTLAEEVRFQTLYLDIEAVRYPERLRRRVTLSERAAEAKVPALILQPLVENAIKHGVSRARSPVTIAIEAAFESAILRIIVEDDGAGGAEARGDPGGIGLANVHDRLEARYGPRATFTAGPRAGGGFTASLEIPLDAI